MRVSQIRTGTVSTQQVPFTFRHVVAFLSIRLRNHPNLLDVLFEFQLGLENIGIQEFSDVTKLPGDELPDTPDLR